MGARVIHGVWWGIIGVVFVLAHLSVVMVVFPA
jgi:hypothetical protein